MQLLHRSKHLHCKRLYSRLSHTMIESEAVHALFTGSLSRCFGSVPLGHCRAEYLIGKTNRRDRPATRMRRPWPVATARPGDGRTALNQRTSHLRQIKKNENEIYTVVGDYEPLTWPARRQRRFIKDQWSHPSNRHLRPTSPSRNNICASLVAIDTQQLTCPVKANLQYYAHKREPSILPSTNR